MPQFVPLQFRRSSVMNFFVLEMCRLMVQTESLETDPPPLSPSRSVRARSYSHALCSVRCSHGVKGKHHRHKKSFLPFQILILHPYGPCLCNWITCVMKLTVISQQYV